MNSWAIVRCVRALLLVAAVGICALACSDSPAADDTCPPGTSGPDCELCEIGTYCPGDTPPAPCEEGTRDHDANPATACEPWSDCAPGEYVIREGTSTRDRRCEPCEDDQFSTTTNADQCQPWTQCEPGTHITQTGSADREQVCSECPDGLVSPIYNATECRESDACLTGEYVVTPPSATDDRLCAACPDGTFSEALNQGRCVSWSTCQAGEYISEAGTSETDRVCADCPDGSYTTEENEPACNGWTVCEPGLRTLRPPTAEQDRTCTRCIEGTYSNTPNQRTCTSWTRCTAGEYVADSPTTHSDRVCADCPQGTYSNELNADQCSEWTQCVPGESYIVDAAPEQDRQCMECPADTFSTDVNSATCQPWTDCTDNQFVAVEGTKSSDRQCDFCGPDEISTGPNAPICSLTCMAVLGIPCDEFEEAYIKASNTDAGDAFGFLAIALDGNTLAIGALQEASGSGGIGADMSDNSAARSGAVYVFERHAGTWSQQAYIKAPAPDEVDLFGVSLALQGDTLVVGAPDDDSGSRGLGGDPFDNTSTDSGAVYVYTRSGSTWSQSAFIKPYNSDPGDRFGVSVALDGDTLAVGATGESSGATGVGGDPFDNSSTESGAVYIFGRAGTTWIEDAYIKPGIPQNNLLFGRSIALDQNLMAIGAPSDSTDAVGVNGTPTSSNTPESGAVYVFVRQNQNWSQDAYIKASNPDEDDLFGVSLALHGNTLAVGAPYEESEATGIDGDQSSNGGHKRGAVYTFERSAGVWSQTAYIKASNTPQSGFFGSALALDSSRLIVGAPRENSDATGISGTIHNSNALGSGAVYAFAHTGTTWDPIYTVKASNTDPRDHFGHSIALDQPRLAIGAPGDASNATGVGGDQTNNDAPFSGAVYLRKIAP